jgi:hypothetical protein
MTSSIFMGTKMYQKEKIRLNRIYGCILTSNYPKKTKIKKKPKPQISPLILPQENRDTM